VARTSYARRADGEVRRAERSSPKRGKPLPRDTITLRRRARKKLKISNKTTRPPRSGHRGESDPRSNKAAATCGVLRCYRRELEKVPRSSEAIRHRRRAEGARLRPEFLSLWITGLYKAELEHGWAATLVPHEKAKGEARWKKTLARYSSGLSVSTAATRPKSKLAEALRPPDERGHRLRPEWLRPLAKG